MTKQTFICAFGFVLAGMGQAQTLISRNSTQNYTYVYGAGGDSHSDSFLDIDTNLVASDGMSHNFFGATSGSLPGIGPYTAEAGIDLAHSYTVAGPLTGFESISAMSNTSVHVAETNAVAQMLSGSPGNGLVFEFTLASPVDYHFSGFVLSSPSEVGAGNYVALQRFDSIVWQQVHNSLFLPGQEGSFDYTGTLTPGLYRLTSANSINGFGTEDLSSEYAYNFQAVPEPLTMLVLVPGLAYLTRKRKKS